MVDIKEKIEEIVKKIKADKDIAAKFKKDPIKTIEGILGVDLPDEMLEKVVDGVKAKLTGDQLGDIAGKLSGLFGKK